jgi:hypothetical protein
MQARYQRRGCPLQTRWYCTTLVAWIHPNWSRAETHLYTMLAIISDLKVVSRWGPLQSVSPINIAITIPADWELEIFAICSTPHKICLASSSKICTKTPQNIHRTRVGNKIPNKKTSSPKVLQKQPLSLGIGKPKGYGFLLFIRYV